MPAKRSHRHSRLFELSIEDRQRRTLDLLKKAVNTLDRSKKAVSKSRELMDQMTSRKKPSKSQQH